MYCLKDTISIFVIMLKLFLAALWNPILGLSVLLLCGWSSHDVCVGNNKSFSDIKDNRDLAMWYIAEWWRDVFTL